MKRNFAVVGVQRRRFYYFSTDSLKEFFDFDTRMKRWEVIFGKDFVDSESGKSLTLIVFRNGFDKTLDSFLFFSKKNYRKKK